MNFVIESGVPVPKRQGGRTGSKYPFAHLNPGESFLVPHGEDKQVGAGTVRSAAGAFSKRNPGAGKFIIRAVDGGVRVWRAE